MNSGPAEANSLEITSLGVWDLSVIEKDEKTERKKTVFEHGNKFGELEEKGDIEGPPGLVDESEDEELRLESEEEEYPVPVPEMNHGGECAEECCGGAFTRNTRKKKRAWRRLISEEDEEDQEKWIQPIEENGEKKCMGLTFQVADVKKPLVAVKRITEKGNWVVFGPGEEDNYIENKKTGDKMLLTPNGRGAYVMDVSFVGGQKTTITVNSGAEESVCPWNWGHEIFGTREANHWMIFRNANGGNIEHYGSRDVKVVSTF